MSKFHFNINKFKKVKEDDKSTTMEHFAGHQITISHKPLSKEQREQLKALPLKTSKYATGGMVEDTDTEMSKRRKAVEIEHPKPPGVPIGKQINMPGFAEGGEVPVALPGQQPVIPEDLANGQLPGQTPTSNAIDYTKADHSGEQPYGVPAATPPEAPEFQPESPVVQQLAHPVLSLQNPEHPAAQQAGMFQQGLEQLHKGYEQEAAAKGQVGNEQAAALGQANQQLKQQTDDFTLNATKINNHIEDAKRAISDQKFEPMRVFSNQTTGGKIATSIALVLGGIGSGITGGENPATKFLNQALERDLESQKLEMNKKENLMNASFRQFGNMRDAADFTRVIQGQVVMNQLQAAAAKAQSPLAQAELNKLWGQKQTEMAIYGGKIAARQTLENPDSDPVAQAKSLNFLRMVDKEQAKEFEGRHVPGMGTAKVPVSEGVRSQLVAKNTFNAALQDYRQFAQKHAGTVMNRATVQEGLAKGALVQGLFRQATNGGVYKESEQGFISGVVPNDPTAYLNSVRVDPKLKAISESNQRELNVLKQSVGLPVAAQIKEMPPRR